MILLWSVRYFDKENRQFRDRNLHLDTTTLDPVIRSAIEFIAESKSPAEQRAILKYRHLFHEGELDWEVVDCASWGTTVGPDDYCEDESGIEITPQELGSIMTGTENTFRVPRGAKQHDIDLMLSEVTPVPAKEVSLTSKEIRILAYFVRDFRELVDSAFMMDGPGTIKGVCGAFSRIGNDPVLETAVTDDEIRSFVTIFRRLYMTGSHDPASFVKAVPIFTTAIGAHPYAAWIIGVHNEYTSHLAAEPDFRPFVQAGTCSFTAKRLIDVFVYTQYAHSPDDRRQEQFNECLNQVHGKRGLLTWMFLGEIWKCSLIIAKAGKLIADWFSFYCGEHGITPEILDSLRNEHPGLGASEKQEDRRKRLFQEKSEELAVELWKQHGQPTGGPAQFLLMAQEQLSREMERGEAE